MELASNSEMDKNKARERGLNPHLCRCFRKSIGSSRIYEGAERRRLASKIVVLKESSCADRIIELAAKLVPKLLAIPAFKNAKIYCWTDSQIVLH